MSYGILSECPHVGSQHATILDIKKLEKVNCCANCNYVGPNLWICLQRNCLRVGCSEQADDHSTDHFHRNNTHCVHMNISSKRTWCYLCEREVHLEDQSEKVHDPFTLTPKPIDNHYNNGITAKTSAGLVGLQNIANTCYMNAALQALSNVEPLTHYFLNCGDLVDHTVEQWSHRSKAGLANSYQRLMREIWCKEIAEKEYVAPRGILYGIRSVHPMFRGFQQHDTQEFLRCFMDQLHEELKEQKCMTSSASASKYISPQMSNSVEEDISIESRSPSRTSSVTESDYETCDSGVSDTSPFISKRSSASVFVTHSCKGTLSDSEGAASQQPQQHPASRSIISDVFDGKLMSSVQCLTCDRISTRDETFQDLSLPIPNRDYLNLLHQTHSLSTQNLNTTDLTSPRSGEGWISWMWNILYNWLWGPSVTLHDCMASFFSADELKGDNMYSCEKCNKLRTGIKYSRILDLPEVLCIHLKRFRHDLSYSSKISSHVHFPLENFDMRPYLHKDCASNISFYNLVSVICHHGTVGGGHYTCFARNTVNSLWYEFDDQHVTEVSPEAVRNCQAYVLFYRKHNPQMEKLRAEARELSASNPVHLSDIRFYVSREWLCRFNTFAEPGPINNWDMLCPHGGLLPSKIELLGQIAVPISQPMWDFLYSKFGGGPALNMLFGCDTCKRASEALSRRQYYELSVFTKYNGMDADLESNAIFAISMPWLRKWQQFARGFTHREPGPINNASIVAPVEITDTSSPMLHVRPGSDYAQINAPLWRFLHGIYDGGPEIILRDSNTEEDAITDQSEYDENSCSGNRDLSDTESNIGQHNTPGLHECEYETSKSPDVPHVKVERKSRKPKTSYPISKDLKQNKLSSTTSKKTKSVVFRSSLRKKARKTRNAMKNIDIFGPKGNYNVPKDAEWAPILKLDKYFTKEIGATPNDFEQSLSYLRHRKKTVDSNAIKIRHHSKDFKIKDKIVLKKFVPLRAADESTEADV